MILVIFLGLFGACGGSAPEPDPATTPEGKLCARAYSSTIDSLDDLFTRAGQDMPPLPEKGTYVGKCLSQSFDEAQLKCLDPKIAAVDDTCDKTMEPVASKVEELNSVFEDARKVAEAKDEEPEEAEGGEDVAEGDAADPAAAVQDALGD